MSWPGLLQKCRRQSDGEWRTAIVIKKKKQVFTIQYDDDNTEEDILYEDKDIRSVLFYSLTFYRFFDDVIIVESPIGESPAVESGEDVEQESCTSKKKECFCFPC